MPKSKSKRRRYQPPPKPKPKPSPPWVGVLFFVLMGIGFLAIIARFALPGVWPTVFDNQWPIVGGLLLIAVAFAVSTRWR
jgi:Cell division protein CrgA